MKLPTLSEVGLNAEVSRGVKPAPRTPPIPTAPVLQRHPDAGKEPPPMPPLPGEDDTPLVRAIPFIREPEPAAPTTDAKKHSAMLGQIAVEVEEWCEHEDCTTVDAVRLLKAELYETKAAMIRQRIRHAL